jgi:hypothetical protein
VQKNSQDLQDGQEKGLPHPARPKNPDCLRFGFGFGFGFDRCPSP